MRRATEHGFTLLEILVVLVVLGILLATLTQGMRFGVQASEKQARSLQLVTDLDAVDRTLRQLIERMKPGGFTGKPPFFVGEARLLSFTSDLPEAFSLSAREADITLAVNAARQLRLFWEPHLTARNGRAPAPASTVLLEGVDHIELSYWGTDGVVPGWQTHWQSQALPGLIRLRIVFVPGSGRLFPDFVIAPKRDRIRP